MTDERPHVTDDLPAYVLDALEAWERARVEQHLAACPTCAGALVDYRAVVGALPLALDPVSPPPEAWTTIRAAAGQRQSLERARERRPAWPRWLRRARWPAVAVAIMLLAVWNGALHHELARRSPGPAPGPEVEALSRRPGRVVILKGVGQPTANARIFVASDGGQGHLAISGLPPLPEERTYQLWFVRKDAPALTGAVFGVDGRGVAWAKVSVPAALDDVRAIIVTEESAPSSQTPTGTPLLAAQDWR
jgi:anti-sigma-K factor RskA